MRHSFMIAAGIAATLAATPSLASIQLTTTPGSGTYAGPAVTYDFENAATTPLIGGTITTGAASNPTRTVPVGSTGNFAVFGPAYTTGVLSLAAFSQINTVSFIWGSLDGGNMVELLGTAGNVLASFTGGNVYAQSQNYSTSIARQNPVVYFNLTGADQTAVRALRFSSTNNSFEIDNVAVQSASMQPVPEPATWAMMVVGFGLAGYGLRRRRAAKTSVSFG